MANKENRRRTSVDDLADFQPPPKCAKKLPLKRFASPLTPQEMSNLEEGPTVANTKKCTDWAVRVFTAWRQARNVTQEDRCPTDLLENPSAGQLNYWLSRFVVEARRADGERYPSATLYQLLSGLLRYARSKSKGCPIKRTSDLPSCVVVSQASPIPFRSADRFQYRHAEEGSGDLGPL